MRTKLSFQYAQEQNAENTGMGELPICRARKIGNCTSNGEGPLVSSG